MTFFPTGSIFDAVKPGGLMGDLLDTPDYRRQRMFDALGGIGSALIQAGAPSPYPTGAMDVLGRGLAGAAQGMSQNEDRYLKRALTASQVASAQSKLERDKKWTEMFTGAGGGAAAAAAGGIPQPGWKQEVSPGSMQPAPAGGPANAIASIESAGQPNNGYGAVGPAADSKGSRAYGKYQVMDYNIGPWTQEVLGKAMTPEEFVANPQAQDQVFQAKFGQYVQQTGDPQKAAAMWFSGRPDTQATNIRDVNGMTPAAYVGKFTAAGGAGPQAPGATPIQYTPQQPKTLPEVVQALPPAVRQMIGVMGPEAGMKELLKYADPETVPVIDQRSGQIVFAPKHALNSGQFLPIDAQKMANDNARLGMDREKFEFEKGKDARDEKAKGQFVRGADGVQRWVPAAQYQAGMPQFDKPPETGPSQKEMADFRTGQTEAATMITALEDYRKEFKNASRKDSIKSVLGYNTPVNTAYNTAALLAKGEYLFNLGVLNGPDLDIIRRTLADPSTFRGAQTSHKDLGAGIDKVIGILNTRLNARAQQLGVSSTATAQPEKPSGGTTFDYVPGKGLVKR